MSSSASVSPATDRRDGLARPLWRDSPARLRFDVAADAASRAVLGAFVELWSANTNISDRDQRADHVLFIHIRAVICLLSPAFAASAS